MKLARSKYRGTLLGVAVGDAIGAPFEGAFRVEDRQLKQLLTDPGPLRYTDDTHMTIGLARSLLECRDFDGPHMTKLFTEQYEREPWRGYGAGPPWIFQMIRQGAAWDEPAGRLFGGTGSYGNGAAMRVAPVALFARGDLDRVEFLARQTARITHTHALGIEGAVLQACAVALLLETPPTADLDLCGLIEHLERWARTAPFRRALDVLRGMLPNITPARVVEEIGNGIEAHTAVPAALSAFLAHPASFRDVIFFALSLGGDTDTIASMAGALAGARGGEQEIPWQWSGSVEGRSELVTLADSLYKQRENT